MSAAIANADTPPCQPFQCDVCQGRFTRLENLKRHAVVHAPSANDRSYRCDFCDVTFSRRDLRHRHLKRKHPEQEDRVHSSKRHQHERSLDAHASVPLVSSEKDGNSQLSRAVVDAELNGGAWEHPQQDEYLDQATPTVDVESVESNPAMRRDAVPSNDTHLTLSGAMQLAHSVQAFNSDSNFVDEVSQFYPDLGRSWTNTSQPTALDLRSDSGSPNQSLPDGLSITDLRYMRDEWFPTPTQIAKGYSLYFSHVSSYVPFIHRPTFDAAETASYLGLSMLCLGYQHGEDPDCGNQPGTGVNLSLRCFHRARVLAAAEEDLADEPQEKLVLVKAYWLLQVCAMMYLCGRDSRYGLKIHSRMISLTRFGDLTQPMPVDGAAETEDLDGLWRQFIKAESHKRTILAVHQIDAMWYQFLSIPRLLSHLELKHDLPCPEAHWNACSAAKWAHLRLLSPHPTASIPYVDAIRRFLSPQPDVTSLGPFDPFGAINIAQFLLSSAREVSGWTTMTGRVSLDRYNALRSSLEALEPFIRPRGDTTATHSVSCEATWEIAMIELRMWSPSHTSGSVQNSIDALLEKSTQLASSCESVFCDNTAKDVQPRVDWFLTYLDLTKQPESEPPWIAVYAFKAFLVAWQLLRRGSQGAMQVVGVEDEDLEGAVEWAKVVFARRAEKQLGKKIIACLDKLGID